MGWQIEIHTDQEQKLKVACNTIIKGPTFKKNPSHRWMNEKISSLPFACTAPPISETHRSGCDVTKGDEPPPSQVLAPPS